MDKVIKLGDLPTSTGKVHQSTCVYDGGGYFMHTTSEGLQRPTEGADREKRLGNLNGFTGGSFAGMVYNPEYLAPSLTTMGGQDATCFYGTKTIM